MIYNYANEVSGRNILSCLLYTHYPHLGVDNGDMRTDLYTLYFKNVEHIEDFHNRILCLQKYIGLYGKLVPPLE